jgi:hypothetical protein
MVVGTPGGSTIIILFCKPYWTYQNLIEYGKQSTHLVFIINGFQARLLSTRLFFKGLLEKKVKGYKINETDKGLPGQVDAILVASKLEGEPIKGQ